MMTRQRIDRLSLGQTAKVMGALYLLFGVIFAVLFGLVSTVVPTSEMGDGSFMFGGIFLIMMPLMYGVFGLISGFLVAFFYNMVSGLTGGLELDLVEAD